MVILEAAAAGVPALGAAVGGIPELIQNGRTGFLFRPRDTREAVERASSLLKDTAMRRKFGAAGRACAVQLTWEAAARRVRSDYESVIREHQQARVPVPRSAMAKRLTSLLSLARFAFRPSDGMNSPRQEKAPRDRIDSSASIP